MDYEKKYKEALERARENFPCVNQGGQAILQDIFSKIKENEDERIKQKLIETIGYFRSRGIDQQLCEKFLAWVEKQGEQKPVNNLKWNELTWEDINTLEGIINNVHYEFRNGIGVESFGKEVLERFREIKGDEYIDSCEQKPVDMSIKEKAHQIAWESSKHYDPNICKQECEKAALEMASWLEKQDNNKSISPEEINKSVCKNIAISLIKYLDENRYEGNMNLSSIECEDLEEAIHNLNWNRVYNYMKRKLERQGFWCYGKREQEK